jgi:hypothetical protein
MIDEGLVALFEADAGVSAISKGTYQVLAPAYDPELYPCVEYKFVGGSNKGTSTTSGTFRQRIELNAYSMDASESARLRNAVIKALFNWRGVLEDGTNVLTTELLNPGTDFCAEDLIFCRMCEFYVLYTLPTV